MSIPFNSVIFGELSYINSVLMNALGTIFSITGTSVIWTQQLSGFRNYYWNYTIATNTKTLTGTPSVYAYSTLGDDNNAYIWYANYPGPGRSPYYLWSAPYSGGFIVIYSSQGAPGQDNQISIAAFVGKTFLIY